MEGLFTFRDNGKIVGQSKNLLTAAGKIAIQNYLAKYSTSFADFVAIGQGTVAASTSDVLLGFEYDREPVTLVSADYSTIGIILKAMLPQPIVGTIYEAGIWMAPVAGNLYGSRMINQFETADGWSVGTINADATKIGGTSLRVSATVSSTATTAMTTAILDLSGYTNADRISFAYNVNDANNSSIKLRFKVDASNYYETTINGANVTSGYHIVQLSKTAFTATGTPTWGTITTLEIAQTAGAGGTNVVDYDGIRMESLTTGPDTVLVSRTVLASPIAKTNIRPMELEYRLRLTL